MAGSPWNRGHGMPLESWSCRGSEWGGPARGESKLVKVAGPPVVGGWAMDGHGSDPLRKGSLRAWVQGAPQGEAIPGTSVLKGDLQRSF